jgi:hypothetical protein
MINHNYIEQNSIEWHEIKWRKIGGTLSKGLFIDSETLFLEMLSQHIEEFEISESFENEAMQRGKDLEPFALEYISGYTAIDFLKTGWLECEENSLLGISPDGISECEKFATEIKCLSRKEHTKLLVEDELPKDKLCQIIHYFTVNPKLEKLYFIAFRPESIKPYIKEFTCESIIDLGWKTKVEVKQYGVKGQEIKPKIESVFDVKTISEWSKIALEEAEKLQTKITEKINKLNF